MPDIQVYYRSVHGSAETQMSEPYDDIRNLSYVQILNHGQQRPRYYRNRISSSMLPGRVYYSEQEKSRAVYGIGNY